MLKASGAMKHLDKATDCNAIWYGNEYGGFYIHPDVLDKDSIVYSFGIGEDITFDKAVINKHHCKVIGFDPTPKSLDWLARQQLPTGYSYKDYGIAKDTGTADFLLPVNEDHVSGSLIHHETVDTKRKVTVPMKSWNDLTLELGYQKVDVVKMDIEGAEYDVLPSILASDVEVGQFLIEFHDRFFDNGRDKTIQSIQLLREHGYGIFGVSQSFEEVSFIRI